MKAMKRLWILALMMVAVQPLGAQMYVDGEVLNFRMSYKAKLLPNIEVASVVIATKDTLLEGREVHKVYGHGATENMYHWILHVDDTYLVWQTKRARRLCDLTATCTKGATHSGRHICLTTTKGW